MSRLEIAEHDGALAQGAVSTIAQQICNNSADMRMALDLSEEAMRFVETQSSSKVQVGVLDVLKAGVDNILITCIRNIDSDIV